MAVEVDGEKLKQGLLGLVVALVEIVRDVLEAEALKRMRGGRLTGAEVERLGAALMELDSALERLKAEQGLADVVRSVRRSLDRLVDDVSTRITQSAQWDRGR